MHITILSVGALKSGPEKEIIDDYADRFRKSGRALGFRSLGFVDVASGGGLDAEGERLIAKVPKDALVLRLDEFGEQMPSKALAAHLAKQRDRGQAHLCFMIGGAAGYSEAVRTRYSKTLAFGTQTWPHRLVKVMLAEQLYRAASLLSGSPYHKA